MNITLVSAWIKKRKKSKNSSKTGLVLPSKMPDTNQNISEVLYRAHQSLHGSYTDQPVRVSTVQVNNNDQTFTCNPNIPSIFN